MERTAPQGTFPQEVKRRLKPVSKHGGTFVEPSRRRQSGVIRLTGVARPGERIKSRRLMRLVVGLLLLMPALPSTHTVHAVDSSTPGEALPHETEFHALWSRYDTPVATGRVSRTWTWGGEVT